MKAIDLYLQKRRFTMAGEHISSGSKILDIGTNCCEIFYFLASKKVSGTGIDPEANPDIQKLPENVQFIHSAFPSPMLQDTQFDAITALAVLEHIPTDKQSEFAQNCNRHLKNQGRMIITVPSPFVDYIIHSLRLLRLIDDDMKGHQHHGFLPGETVPLFTKMGFVLELHRSFQFGLNNLYVFRKTADA
jgi:2-polyprenyl-3-methyl-5-hydroxy-6-metoxy-1,4-benzoquinol methylase